MLELLYFISLVIGLYWWIVVAAVIWSWLISFGVIDRFNPTARTVGQVLAAMTEPLLRPIRRVMPDLGPIDLSPVVLLLLCSFVLIVVIPNIAKLFA